MLADRTSVAADVVDVADIADVLDAWADSALRDGRSVDRQAAGRAALGLAALHHLAVADGATAGARRWSELRNAIVHPPRGVSFDAPFGAIVRDVEARYAALAGTFSDLLAADFASVRTVLPAWMILLHEHGAPARAGVRPGAPRDRAGVRRPFDVWFDAAAERFGVSLTNGAPPVPADIARLMVRLAGVRAGTSLLDLRCGTAPLLVAAMDAALDAAAPTPAVLRGAEPHPGLCAIARLRVFFRDPAGVVVHADLLRETVRPSDGLGDAFDRVVVAVPPGLRVSDVEARLPIGGSDGPVPSLADTRGVSGDAAGLLAALTRAGPLGRIIALVSPGFLFRGGADARLREWLVREDLVRAVVNLPANTLPGLSSEPALLVLDRATAEVNRGHILFGALTDERPRGRRRVPLPADAVDAVVRACGAGAAHHDASLDGEQVAERGFSFVVARESRARVQSDGGGLQPHRYAVRAPPPAVAPEDRLAHARRLEHRAQELAHILDARLEAWTRHRDATAAPVREPE